MITFNTCQLSFKSRIIDVHTHVGQHINTAYTKDMLDTFVKQPLENNDVVEKMIVSDTDTFKGNIGEYEGNKRILQTFKEDTRYAFLASCCPQNGNVGNIERVMREFPNKFVGLKFHPNENTLPVTDDRYTPYFEFADRNGLPCMFHTQVAVDDITGTRFRTPDGAIDRTKMDLFGDPEFIYQASKKHKNAPFIMAHMGGGWRESHTHAVDVLVESIRNGDANLYADISWVDIDSMKNDGYVHKNHIVSAIKRLKGIGEDNWTFGDQSYRLIFGTDAPIARFKEGNARTAYTTFVEEIKDAIRKDKDLAKDSEQIIDDLFYNNAKKLFFKERIEQPMTNAVQNAQKASSKTGKILAGVIAGIIAVGGGAYALKNNSQNNNSN